MMKLLCVITKITDSKLFDKTGKFKGNLNLISSPWDLAVINDNLVIELFPKLKCLRTLQLDEGCYGTWRFSGTKFL